jgi:hypothetical protein
MTILYGILKSPNRRDAGRPGEAKRDAFLAVIAVKHTRRRTMQLKNYKEQTINEVAGRVPEARHVLRAYHISASNTMPLDIAAAEASVTPMSCWRLSNTARADGRGRRQQYVSTLWKRNWLPEHHEMVERRRAGIFTWAALFR